MAYDETKKDVNKWQQIVVQNRVAEQLVFPLNREQFRVKTVAESIETMTVSPRLFDCFLVVFFAASNTVGNRNG